MASILEKIKDFFKKFTGNEQKMLGTGNKNFARGNFLEKIDARDITDVWEQIRNDYFKSFDLEKNPVPEQLEKIFEENFDYDHSDDRLKNFILNCKTIDFSYVKGLVLDALNRRLALGGKVEGSEKTAQEIYEELRNGNTSNLELLTKEALSTYMRTKGIKISDKIAEKLFSQSMYKLKPFNNSPERKEKLITEISRTMMSELTNSKKLDSDRGKRLAIELTVADMLDEGLTIPKGIKVKYLLENGTNIVVPITNTREYKDFTLLNKNIILYDLLRNTGREEDALEAQKLEPTIQKLFEAYNARLPEVDKRYLQILEKRLASAKGKDRLEKEIKKEIEKTKARIKKREEKQVAEETESVELSTYVNNSAELAMYKDLLVNSSAAQDIEMEDYGPIFTDEARTTLEAYRREKQELDGVIGSLDGKLTVNECFYGTRNFNERGEIIARVGNIARALVKERERETETER